MLYAVTIYRTTIRVDQSEIVVEAPSEYEAAILALAEINSDHGAETDLIECTEVEGEDQSYTVEYVDEFD
jgi:hypothetical protein